MSRGMFNRFDDVFILDGLRTPQVDYQGAFADANPIDLGIKAARSVITRAGLDAGEIDSVITGNMAPGGFDQFYVARHIGLYAGVPLEVPALNAQRICGTGFELFRQAGEQIALGAASLALVVGTESMTRNPIAAFDHRQGFRLGAPLGFKDFMWEALTDPAAVSMIQTAENVAERWGVSRDRQDAFALESQQRAVAAIEAGRFADQIVPVEVAGRKGEVTVVDRDEHPRADSTAATPEGSISLAASRRDPLLVGPDQPLPRVRGVMSRRERSSSTVRASPRRGCWVWPAT